MDLSRAIAKFAKNEIWGWNPSRQCFEPTGVKGSLSVYDRFISDRTFGTKKRLLLTPCQDYIPPEYDYIRVGDSIARFMVDSLNEDIYSDNPYANTYLLREAKYKVEIGALYGESRASGVGGKKTFVAEQVVFGDYERYTGNSSTEFNTVDYTVSDIFLPLSVDITSKNLIRIDGKLYDITEVSRVSNLLWIRGQKQAEDELVIVKQSKLYECDISSQWGVPDLEMNDEGSGYPLQFNSPCQTLLIEITDGINETGMIPLAGFGARIEGMECEMALYDGNRNLIVRSDTNEMEITQYIERPCYLAVVPAYFSLGGQATIYLSLPLPV